MEWWQIMVAVLTLLLGSGASVSFWAWTRSNIMRLAASQATADAEREKDKAVFDKQIAVLKAEIEAIHTRCRERAPAYTVLGEKLDSVAEQLHGRINDLHRCVANKDSETAQAIGRLEGLLEGKAGRSSR